MSDIPADRQYAETHEWIRSDDDGSVVIGITDHAQDQLGDLVYVELPEPGKALIAGEACAVVESVKAASDIVCPADGEVLEANDALTDEPERVNRDPYGDGWMIRMMPSGPLPGFMDAAAYEQHLASD